MTAPQKDPRLSVFSFPGLALLGTWKIDGGLKGNLVSGPSPPQLLRDAVRRAAWKAGEASVVIPERVILSLSLSLVEGLGYHNEWMQLGSPLTESQTALGLRWSQSAVTLPNPSSRTERRRSVSSQTSDMFYKRGCRAVEVSSSGHACWWPRFKKTKQNTFFWLIHGPHFFCIGLRPFL